MSVPRKPPSVSPPVQVQAQSQPRGPQQYPFIIRQLSQEELQRNQVFSQQQFSQGFAVSGSPHDMSKQQMPTHVPPPGQTPPQPGLQMYQNQHQGAPRPGTPGGGGYQGGATYHGGGGPLFQPPGTSPHGTSPLEEVGFQIQRQSVPQTIRGGGGQRPQMTMTSSPGQPMYNPTMQPTMFVPGQPPFMATQPQMILQTAHPPPTMQVTYQAGPRPSLQGPQYTMPTTSQQAYQMTSNPTHTYFPQQSSNPMFYPPAPTGMVTNQQRQVTPQSAPYQSTRERKIIAIVDPDTGRNIYDEITSVTKSNTPPQSSSNSSRATPVTAPSQGTTPPPAQAQQQQQDIASIFAAKVAATLSQKNTQPSRPQHTPPTTPSPVGYQPSKPTVQPAIVEKPEVKVEVVEPVVEAENLTPPPLSEPVDSPRDEVVSDNVSSEPQVEPVVSEPVSVVVPPPSTEQDFAKEEVVSKDLITPDVSTESPPPQQEKEEEVVVEEEVREKEVEVEKDTVTEPETRTVSEDLTPTEEVVVVVEEVPVEAEVVSETTVAPCKPETPAPIPVKEDTKDDGKESRKKSHKQKMKDLNQKGKSKEGSDMDAFSVPTTPGTETPPPQQATPPLAATNDLDAKPLPEAEPAKAEPAQPEPIEPKPEESKEEAPAEPPTSESNNTQKERTMEKVEIKVVEDENKVAEKNEKNEELWRKSGNAEPWRKSSNEEPWRKSSNEEPWRKSSNEEPWRKSSNEEPWRKSNDSPATKSNSEQSNDDSVKEEKETGKEKGKEEETSTTSSSIETVQPVIGNDKIELKYKYREDQWSPINTEGKKSYDRNFLLQMQYSNESLEKPEGLPKLPDVILDKPLPRNDSTRQVGMSNLRPGSLVDFTPGFFRPTPSGGKGPNMDRRNRSQQKNVKEIPKRIISVSTHLDSKLHQTENAWKPTHKKEPVENDEAELYRQVRAVLNKLTPQKFSTLLHQIMALKIDTEKRLTGTIDLIFEKALDEPSFSVAYANMCKHMMKLEVPSDSKPEETVTFRKVLILRCQGEFEKDRSDEIDSNRRAKEISEKKTIAAQTTDLKVKKEKEDEIKLLEAEKILAEQKARRRSLGNIRFIGELFKQRMLLESIMHECVVKLLRASDEDSLECLCRLLTTIGKDFDGPDKKEPNKVNMYFQKMETIINEKKTSARTRFMLQDVMDLRRNKWVPRREDNKPKMIDQIHREAELEDQQKAQLLSTLPSKHNMYPDQGGGGGGNRGRRPVHRGQGSSNSNQGEDGWQSVGKPVNLDPTRMKITKQKVDETIQLGPAGNMMRWGRGSSGGGGRSSQEDRTQQTSVNRFDALSGRTEGHDQARPSPGMGRGSMTTGRDSKGRQQGTTQLSRGKVAAARASQEQDREAALSAVRSSNSVGAVSRNIIGGGRTPQRPPPANRSWDGGRQREAQQPEAERPAAPPAGKNLPAAEIKKKTTAIVDEYLGINDIKEAIECVKELDTPAMMHELVAESLNHVLEKSAKARNMVGKLLSQLITHNVIDTNSYLNGLGEVLEFAEDMEIDIPKIWQYYGELIGPVFDDGRISLGVLKKVCEPLASSRKAHLLVAAVLQDLLTRMDSSKVAEMWTTSGLQWSAFITDREIDDFVAKNKLEFTLGCANADQAGSAAPLSMARIEKEFERLIISQSEDNQTIFNWVQANVGEQRSKEPQFIRALVTAVCYSAISTDGTGTCKANPPFIVKRSSLLLKYLDHQGDLELQALYAVQALVHRFDHPAGVLRAFFDTLYDEDIISEDAFNQWEASMDPAEQAGKGVAKSSVVQFFTWLREAEEESQDDN